MKTISSSDCFLPRHIGSNTQENLAMLRAIDTDNVQDLVAKTIPASILNSNNTRLDEAMGEYAFLQHIRAVAQKNKLWKSYIGLGYYNCIVPSVIQRNIFENPAWYTQYTPYQAEIAQGRLEALLNFQTMVSDLTAMDLANASLLDEATAAAEAMLLCYRLKNKRAKGKGANIFFVSDECFPTTIDVLKTRAEPLGIELIIGNHQHFEPEKYVDQLFGALVQYPTQAGKIIDYQAFTNKIHQAKAYLSVSADLLSLALLKPPGEWGADVVVGSTQRLGVPMGYGGPHAAYFATHQNFARQIPGRIIGISVDRHDRPAYRMALQTREQHIRREKATSNICTAQALLAIMSSMYAVYHGAEGLRNIAQHIHSLTVDLSQQLQQLGYQQVSEHFFDTLLLDLRQHTETSGLRVRRVAELDEVNFRYFDDSDLIGISLDETCTQADVARIVQIFAEAIDVEPPVVFSENRQNYYQQIPDSLCRKTDFLTHPVFQKHRSETQLLRYMKRLETKDLSLAHAMIPLGSCTMKLNATTQLVPVSYPEFAHLHPFVPVEQAKGYQEIFAELSQDLCAITGFAACSLQPNSGAQGEYTGLLTIRAYHLANGNQQRTIALIPTSAHGTNPASAVLAGMKVVLVKCDENGNIDVADLQKKAKKYQDSLAALMITYPSTHGVFEEAIQEICAIVHQYGGQVYMDGANMNAQVGLTNPALIGADVCHLNLHKTFSIPHGGGGPGMGPICVAKHLASYLPSHSLIPPNNNQISAIATAPYGSASILLISYSYIKMLGQKGVQKATEQAILNANYLKVQLEKHYDVLYVGKNGRVAHELIIDLRSFKRSCGIEVTDVAKRLMDYGFHAPTVSFPVVGTMMIEPTESESKAELDRFCAAMAAIRQEIEEVQSGLVDIHNNVLKNAPHTLYDITSDNWARPYTRQKAAYPLPYVRENKFWPSANRVNSLYGDRNLVCSCVPVAAYAE